MINYKKYYYVALNNLQTTPYHLFHLLRRKLLVEYKLNTGYSLFPDFITILVTERCNFFCDRCCADFPLKTKQAIIKNELTTTQIIKFLDEVAWFRPSVYFCGGEPTLRGDLYELLHYAKSKKLITACTTNASLLGESQREKIFKAKLDFLSFSLDGPRGYHDRVRGYKGAHDLVITNISELIKYRQRNRLHYPHVRMSTIVDPNNLENAFMAIDIAKKLKVDELNFGMLMFYTNKAKRQQAELVNNTQIGGDSMLGQKIEDNYQFPHNYAQMHRLYQRVRQEKLLKIVINGPLESEVEQYFNPQKYPSKSSTCLTPWFTASLRSNGDIELCQGLRAGNIKNERFLKIWNKPIFRKFRLYRKKQPNYACFRCGESQNIRF